MKNVTLILALIIGLFGCDSSSVTSQAGVGGNTDLTGSWSGNLQSKHVGPVQFRMTIAQQDKINIESQQEGRQIITGTINFTARDCYTSATVNSETSRIDNRSVQLNFNFTGGSALSFIGSINGARIQGTFTAEVTCDFVSPIVTTDTSESGVETTVMEDEDGNVTGTETTTSETGGSETSGGEVVSELVADGGAMTIQRI